MAKYLLKRLFYLILTLFLIATITFFMMKLLPGTPLSNESKLSHSQIQMIYHTYGLDKPVWQQYLIYLAGMVRGNFGLSFQFDNQPVSYLLATRMPASFQLGIQAMIVGVLLGIIVGGIAAIRRNTWVDGTMTITVLHWFESWCLSGCRLGELLVYHSPDHRAGGFSVCNDSAVYSNRNG